MLNIFCLSEIEGGKTHVALYMIELYNYKTEDGKTMAFIEKKNLLIFIFWFWNARTESIVF